MQISSKNDSIIKLLMRTKRTLYMWMVERTDVD